jgi:hypothetical protein
MDDILGKLLGPIVGAPAGREEEKGDAEKAPIQAPEFDLTQYAKKLAIVVGVIFPAVLAALKAADVNVTDGIVIGSLGVTAAALIGACLVMAADLAARAYSDRSTRWTTGDSGKTATVLDRSPALMTVWLRGETAPCPVVAVDRDKADTAYLVLRGSTSKKGIEGHEIVAYDDAPEWVPASEVTASSLE